MRHNPFKIVSDFEETVADYTGAPYAVATDSCTNAIFLCLMYYNTVLKKYHNYAITIPSKTYISPALSVIHSGRKVVIDTQAEWNGIYQLKPTNIYDAAKRLTSNMYIPGSLMCLSFHQKKRLPIGKGGMILTDNIQARDWFRKASYEGRSRDKSIYDDNINMLGWNMYMKPKDAAAGLEFMHNYPEHMEDLPNNYRDLTTFEVFKNCKVI